AFECMAVILPVVEETANRTRIGGSSAQRLDGAVLQIVDNLHRAASNRNVLKPSSRPSAKTAAPARAWKTGGKSQRPNATPNGEGQRHSRSARTGRTDGQGGGEERSRRVSPGQSRVSRSSGSAHRQREAAVHLSTSCQRAASVSAERTGAGGRRAAVVASAPR